MSFKTFLLISLTIQIHTSSNCGLGCLKCDNSQICQLCDMENLFYLNGTNCIKSQDQNCLQINSAGICLKCAKGYFISFSEENCQKSYELFPNCKEISQRGDFCKKCSENFTLTLNKKHCMENIKNCKKLSDSSDHSFCQECESGFILSQNHRVCFKQNLPNCVEVSQKNGKCLQCEKSHRPTDDHSKCLREIPHCADYQNSAIQNEDLHCETCEAGFYVSLDARECLKIQDHCQTYDFKTRLCKKCNEGYLLTNDKNKCLILISNCLEYATANSKDINLNCLKCLYEFEALNGKCVPKVPETKIFNCRSLSKTNNRCEQCHKNYTLTSDGLFCFQQIDFCVKYDFTLEKIVTCQNCYLDFPLKKNKCHIPQAQNCLKNRQDGSCEFCEKGFAISSDGLNCLPAIEKCALYTKTTALSKIHFCRNCQGGFHLTKAGTCQPNPVHFCRNYDFETKLCGLCVEGFRLTDDFAKCLPEIAHCEKYLDSNSEFMAHVCLKCADNALFWKGKCNLRKIANCQVQNPRTGLCESCDPGFTESGDGLKCLPQIAFCDEYATFDHKAETTKCILCQRGYLLKNNNCLKHAIANCQQMDEDSLLSCQKCAEGFRLTNDHGKCLKKIDNCATYGFSSEESFALECRVCNPAFALHQNLCRPKVIQACLAVSRISGLCESCGAGFRLSDDHKKCFPEIEGCEEYFESSEEVAGHICRICHRTFLLVKGRCQQKFVKFCEFFERESGECKKCSAQFLPSDNGQKCLRDISHCLEYYPTEENATKLFCKNCEVGFQLISGLCIENQEIPNCTDYNLSKNQCVKCREGFQATSDKLKCLEEIANCENYYKSSLASEEFFCDRCKKNYVVIGKKCELRHINNCNKYSEDGECRFCSQNYRATDDGLKCLFDIANCLIYSPSSSDSDFFICEKCLEDFVIENGKCLTKFCKNKNLKKGTCEVCEENYELTADKSKCLPKIDNCLIYSESSFRSKNLICAKCQAGFRFDNGLCAKIEVANCEHIDFDTLQCFKCAPGYFITLDKLKCLKTVKHCLEYKGAFRESKKAKCIFCEEGFILFKNHCVTSNLKNCQEINFQTKKCLKCRENFAPTNDSFKCLRTISSCSQYAFSSIKNNSFSCVKCANDFELANNQCLFSANCKSFDKIALTCKLCAKGFSLTTDKKKCLPEIPKCIEYAASNFKSAEFECKQCDLGHHPLANKCRPKVIRNCSSTDDDGTCRTCREGFRATDDKLACLREIPHCAVFQISEAKSANHKCLECQHQFELFDDQLSCFRKVPNCLEYNLSKTFCKKCQVGHELISNGEICSKIISKCVKYEKLNKGESERKCVECEKGYKLQYENRTCVSKLIANCLNVSLETGICRKCLNSMIVTNDGQACLPSLSFCHEYQSSGKYDQNLKCKKCKLGYKIEKNGCISSGEEICLRWDAKTEKCLICPENYIWIESIKKCLEAISNCETHLSQIDQALALKCKKCKTVFSDFNNGLACQTPIPNCAEYANDPFYCVECDPNYILTLDGEKCLREIDGCVHYDEFQSSNTESLCLECLEDYFLKPSRLECAKSGYPSNHENRDDGELEADLECDVGWRITADAGRCLPEIDQCGIYDYSDASSGFHSCLECFEGWRPAFGGAACAKNK